MTYEATGTLLMDDFEGLELEVTSLREAARQNGSPEADGHDTSQADGVAPIASPATRTSARGTGYWRQIRLVIAGVCVLALLALVLGRSPATTAIVGNMFGIVTPTPTTPLTLGMDKIYPISSVPWGTLRVDGRVQTFVVQPGYYQPVRLSRGSHTLEYQAAPFPTLRCTISAPAAPTDTCPQVSTSSRLFNLVPPDVRDLGREIDLGATPKRLPADQRAALSAVVDAALNVDTPFHTDVAPGERYATANGGIAVAAQPLTATLRMTHAPLVDVVGDVWSTGGFGGPICADICVDAFSEGGINSNWPLAVAATLAWRYTATNGVMVAETPLDPGSPGQYTAHVAVLWEHQQWTAHLIDEDFGNSLCNLGQSFIQDLYAGLSRQAVSVYDISALAQYTSPNSVDGCYITYKRTSTIAKKVEPTSGYLYRLGVLFAANAQAQRLFPKLPVADAHDQDIIRQTGAPTT